MKNYKIFLIFLIPIITAFLFEIVTSKIYLERFFNFLENIYFVVLLLIFTSLILDNVVKKYYLKVVFVFTIMMLIFETGYYHIFNTKFSGSSIFIISQTNITEVKEFLTFYLNIKLITLISFFIIYSFFIFFEINKIHKYRVLNIQKKWLKKTIITFLSIFLISFSYLRRQNLPFLVAKSFFDLKNDSYFEDEGFYGESSGEFNNSSKNSSEVDEISVVIIGESTSKNHMSIYDYNRNTSPLLNEIKEELLIYKDVISSHAYTVGALKKALTLDNSELIKSSVDGSIIQLMNSANYNTYWLSNQNPIGFHESLISTISKASDERFFLTTAKSEKNIIFDENLFPILKNILNNEKKRKMIFLQLQGTHLNYKNRYPEEFNVFNGNPPASIFDTKDVNKIINEYDNAVLYNDFVIRTIIDMVKAMNVSSYVLYFSDHGEEVYDTIEFSGHNDDVGSLPMFQIPFVLWQSEIYKSNNKIDIELDRAYMTDDLFHSIADLCDIDNVDVDLDRSIFSETFKKRKRIILNNKDYDSLLLKNEIK